MDRKKFKETFLEIDEKYLIESEEEAVMTEKKGRFRIFLNIGIAAACVALISIALYVNLGPKKNRDIQVGALDETTENGTTNETVNSVDAVTYRGRVMRISETSGMSYIDRYHNEGKIMVLIDGVGPCYINGEWKNKDGNSFKTGDYVQLVGDKIEILETYPGTAMNVDNIITISEGNYEDLDVAALDGLFEAEILYDITCAYIPELETTITPTGNPDGEIEFIFVMIKGETYTYNYGGDELLPSDAELYGVATYSAQMPEQELQMTGIYKDSVAKIYYSETKKMYFYEYEEGRAYRLDLYGPQPVDKDTKEETPVAADVIDSVAGKYFSYEGGGFKGSGEFYIGFDMLGNFDYYEGDLSSYIGRGNYTEENGIITITDFGDNKRVNRFKLENNTLIWIAEGSSNFIYVKLVDGAKFDYINTEYSEDLRPTGVDC